MRHYLNQTQRLFLAEMDLLPWGQRNTSALEQIKSTNSLVASTNFDNLQQILKTKPHEITVNIDVNNIPTAHANIGLKAISQTPINSQAIADWENLSASIKSCNNCPLQQKRRNVVVGVGDQKGKILIIGDAPSAEEDGQGLPFVGQAGQLLDSMLAAINLNRQQMIYLTNVIKCHTPSNRAPLDEEIANCFPYLSKQIEFVQPSLIVLLGQSAVRAVLNVPAPISELRGKVLQYASIPTIVSYHPEYLLRNLPDKLKAWEDLLRIKQHLQNLQNLPKMPNSSCP